MLYIYWPRSVLGEIKDVEIASEQPWSAQSTAQLNCPAHATIVVQIDHKILQKAQVYLPFVVQLEYCPILHSEE